jgi:hypothetical protein
MLRSLRSLSLVLAAAGLLAPAAAHAAPAHTAKKVSHASRTSTKSTSSKTKVTYPAVQKVTPLKLGIGDKLTLTGTSFRSGTGKNFVVFKRDGGRALFVKADKSTSRQVSVTVPAKLLPFLQQKSGVAQPTKFRLRVMAKRLGKAYTKVTMSPVIGPTSAAAGNSADCDGDGVPNTKDTDDDNDLLSDTTEAQLGTDPCKRDSDGDGMSDGWEVQSAKDRNGGTYPRTKPSPNPLNNADAAIDADGDGLTNLEEYTAWATFGGNQIPLSYSGGNPASGGRGNVPAQLAYMDRDGNGVLSDLERDADGDGIPNMDEAHGDFQGNSQSLARLITSQSDFDSGVYDFGIFNPAYIKLAETQSKKDPLSCGGINQVPFYCVDKISGGSIGVIDVQKVDSLDWLTADSDGDGVRDDNDDVDHDGVPNMAEYQRVLTQAYSTRKLAPLDACVPSIDNAACLIGAGDIDKDGIPNGQDPDADGDGLSNDQETGANGYDATRVSHTDPLMADSDRDGVSDLFEFQSAIDLNKSNRPYPGKRSYPNALDGTDGDLDFDQDGMTLREEYGFWLASACTDRKAKLATTASCNLSLPLSYSDGKQASDPLDPATKDGQRDADADGLTNWVEAHGPLSGPGWWDAFIGEIQNVSMCGSGYVESTYPGPKYLGLNAADWDTDGDGIPDGADDVDHDGWTNAQEQTRPGLFTDQLWCTTYVSTRHAGTAGAPAAPADRSARMQPFNPCKPTYSSACHDHPPTGYYSPEEDWRSPYLLDGP